jgi:hypothetical protein
VIPLVSAALTIIGSVIAFKLTQELGGSPSLPIVGVWMAAGIIVTYLLSRLQARSQEVSPEVIKERVSQLEPELRKQVQARSYGARRQLIEAPLRELDLDITPRLGWVRDHRLIEPEPLSERKGSVDDIVAAFDSSKRRMLIVGEPGSGKTIAAYSLIEYLDNTEGDQRMPLLVNLSAWEAQDNFETFLVDYLCSSVGYEVHERAVASAFVDSGRYNLILDGLDEIPLTLRAHFSERLDEFVSGLPSEVGVLVTCRTREYEQLLTAHSTGLGLVQAVEILPLTSEQLESALAELAKEDEDWELFLSQQHLAASQRARAVLSSPLFLNLAVAAGLRPRQLLECDDEQEIRDLVLDGYLDGTLADQRHYESKDARRYLIWITRFLNGDEISPFGLKTFDHTVFDLANLTPSEPPKRYWLYGALIYGLIFGTPLGLVSGMVAAQDYGLIFALIFGLVYGLISGLVVGLILALLMGLVLALGYGLRTKSPFRRSAVSSRLTFVWPSTRRQLLGFIRRAGRGLVLGVVVALVLGLISGLISGLFFGLGAGLGFGLLYGLSFGLFLGIVLAMGYGLLETRSVLITSRTPKEARSRSLIAALTWLVCGLIGGLVASLLWDRAVFGPLLSLYRASEPGFVEAMEYASGRGPVFTGLSEVAVVALPLGLILALRNGGWFVLLQKVAHRRLAKTGSLPRRPYDLLEWGIETQIFRRVGGGVRFRHNLIQLHLASTSAEAEE